MDWRTKGLCRRGDPELWFPVGNSGPAREQAEQAKAICRRCPVMKECLEWALEHGVDDGVYGAMTAQERRALRRAA